MSLTESAGGTGTWPTNAGAVTTGTITPASGDLLVAIAVCGNGDNAAATSIAMSGTGAMSGTWTLKAHLYLTTGPMAAVFMKDAGASPASGTATATFSSPIEGSGLIVRRFAGAAAAASQTGVTVTAGSAGGGVYTAATGTGLTTGSRVVGGFADSSNSITLTANAASTIYNKSNGSGGDTEAAFEASSASTSGTSVTLGFTNTGSDSTSIVLVEVLPGGTTHTATASLTVTPSLSAVPAHGNVRTASLTATPALAASQVHAHFPSAALAVTPVLSASGTHAHFPAASLTVTPVLAAAEVHGNARTASLTVTPALSASGTSGLPAFTASAALTVTPSLSAPASAAHVVTASLTVTPVLAAARTGAHPRTASLTVTPVLAAAPAVSVTAALTVTPVLAATAVHLNARTAALTVPPALAATRVHASTRTASLTASPVLTATAAAVAPLAFPAVPLDLDCELNLGGTWTDVSQYVYQRAGDSPPVTITRGRPDESSQANPAAAAWEWNNRDGRFSPKNPLSPYFGMLGRNTPVRWSVPAQRNYLRLENNSSDRATAPDAANLDIAGSIEMRIAVRLSDWQGGMLAAKWDSGNCWEWRTENVGTMRFAWFDGSSVFNAVSSTAPVPFTAGDFAMRLTLDAATGNVTFYTAPSIDGAYTQLGDIVAATGGAATSIRTAASPLTVGYSVDLGFQTCGRVYEFRLYTGIGGTVAADPVFTARSAGTTSWTDAQGNAWSTAGGAEISARDYRFHGEMSAQPPKWDVTGTDQAVTAAAGGPLRRLSQGTANAMSAMKRAILLQTGSLAPQAYWSLEDAAGASVFGASLGGLPMTFDANPAPDMATDSSFIASAPLPTLNGSRLYGRVAPYSGGNSIIARWLCKLGTVTLLPGLTYAPLARISTSGTVRALYVVAFATSGTLGLIGYDSSGTDVINTGALAFGAAGAPLYYSVEIQLVSGNVQASLVTLAPGASSGFAETVTLSGGTVGNCSVISLNPNALFTDTVAGHVTLQTTDSSLFALGQPLNGWTGELAASRYARLAGENGYQARIIGSPAYSAAMGPQSVATLSSLLNECEAADLGQQLEPRQVLALGYRTLASMCAQPPRLTMDYSASQPGGVNGGGSDSGLDPTYDDQLLANDWTVTRGSSTGSQGATVQVQLDDGSALSISNPPIGVGDYAKTQTVNTQYDAQLQDVAGWMVHAGTVDQARWPGIPVNLARAEIQAGGLYYPVLDADIGDYLELANLPDVVLYDPVKQLLFGSKESLGGFHHTVEFNAVPEVPYEVIVLDDPVYGRVDTDGSTLASSVSSSATALSVATASGFPLWTTAAADFPFDVNIGGERVTVTNVTGTSSPQSFTVTRAVNDVVKSQAAGADVRLFFPPILSLI